MQPDELKGIRQERGLTQEGMAVELDVSVNTYRNWEYGTRGVPKWVVEKLRGPREVELKGVPASMVARFMEIAREKGMSPDELFSHYVKEGIKRSLALILVAGAGFATVAEDTARLICRGRRREGCAMEMVEEV